MATTKRGGVRKGAGRKPVLSEFKRLGVGGEVEKRLRAAQNSRFVASIMATYEGLNLASKWAALQAIKVNPKTRRRTLRKNPAADLVLDVRDNIKSRNNGKRFFRNPGAARHADRRKVIHEVANELSKKLGKPLTPRYVEKCLEAYRAYEKWQATQDRETNAVANEELGGVEMQAVRRDR